MRSARRAALAGACLAAASAPLAAQPSPAADRPPLDAERRTAVIDGALAHLGAGYVFPETAAEMERAVRDRLRRGEYDHITDPAELADSLTAHLRAVSRDGHLRVLYSDRVLPPDRDEDAEPTPERREAQAAFARSVNYGIERVERLRGNVGLLELRGFIDGSAEGLEETVAAALTLLAHTDALIVDLRRNGGGDPVTVALISSYLFGDEPVHLNSLYWRPDDRTEEFWTRAEVAGPRYGPDRPVYVLTSGRTFSAGEEFTYNLRNLERATIVGETTGGGAHPGGMRRIDDHFGVWVPSGRAISPVTGTNWEGTGVAPDVEVPQAEALHTAHLAALRAVRARTEAPDHRAALDRLIAEMEGEAP